MGVFMGFDGRFVVERSVGRERFTLFLRPFALDVLPQTPTRFEIPAAPPEVA